MSDESHKIFQIGDLTLNPSNTNTNNHSQLRTEESKENSSQQPTNFYVSAAAATASTSTSTSVSATSRPIPTTTTTTRPINNVIIKPPPIFYDDFFLNDNDFIYEEQGKKQTEEELVEDAQADSDVEDEEDAGDESFEKVTVGLCAMEKKVNSKPMEEILNRLRSFNYFEIIKFPQDMILNSPIEEWPRVDCLISFYSNNFPLKKAQDYANKYRPFLINNLDLQWDLMDRVKVYQTLKDSGIEHPRYAIKYEHDDSIIEQEDQIEIDGQVFNKPFVEKPVNADDHNIYIYFPSSAGGGSQRLFRKIGFRSSIYSQENRIRRNGSYIYEEFMPTDGTDVKVYTVGPEYAHAEARKSPALDGVVERDENGKEVRYPVMLRTEEKIIAKKIVLAFQQSVCGFDLLRANGKSYVCDVNGFSFVKNSTKYYDDCSSILAHMILKEIAPQRHIPYQPISYQAEEPPIVPTTFGTMMELRCVIAVMRHGDRTPKQKMKMEVRHRLFFELFEKYSNNMKENHLKLKRPGQLQEVLDIARKLLQDCQELNAETLPTKETKTKLVQLKCVLEMYGHFSGINRKVQLKYQPYGKPRSSSSDEGEGTGNESSTTAAGSGNDSTATGGKQPSLLLILKWGGELTADGKMQAEQLGTAFRKLYPGGEGTKSDAGFLRLHSTYRHDLKIYASDEGRVQMTAAAFTKGLLALDGELAPILVQMVKSANTNGLLDNDSMSAKWQNEVKTRLRDYLTIDKEVTEDIRRKIDPTGNYSIQSSLDFIENPVEMCRRVDGYLKELVDIIRNKILDGKYYDLKLYHDETWELMLRRWSKLEKDFYNRKKEKFEISKIPDIYDSIKYDLMHNRAILNFDNAFNLYMCSKALAHVVIPQEYGITQEEKLKIAQGIVAPLLRKIQIDFKSNLTGIWNCDLENVNQLHPKYSSGIQTPGRHVRTRLYFTSESHIYSLLTVLKFGKLFDTEDEQWTKSLNYLNTVPELNYLTQIVIMLYEDPSVAADSEKRFHVELHFSSGSYADFETFQLTHRNSGSVTQESAEDISHNSTEESISPKSGSLPKSRINSSQSQSQSSQQQAINPGAAKIEKKSPFSGITKRFPIKLFNKELQTLPEPGDVSVSFDSKPPIEAGQQCSSEASKPRSFEDEQHQERLNTYNNTVKTKLYKDAQSQSYSHYNTFHGGESNNYYNYLPLGQVFRNRSLVNPANSSPDLNQHLQNRPYYQPHLHHHHPSHYHHHHHHHHHHPHHYRKSFSVIYHEMMKVRYIRPLETLHNNLCFRVLNEFLNRMIADKEEESNSSSSNGSKKNAALQK